jgi:CheY-like chemotaxis protein
MNVFLFNSSSTPPEFPADLLKTSGRGKKTKTPRVLVVDDERIIADTIVQILNGSGFTAHAAYNAAEAIELAQEVCPDLVLSDVMMPDTDGVEASIAIRGVCPTARIVLFSGHATTTELLDRARERGHDFELLAKPLHPSKLIDHLKRTL